MIPDPDEEPGVPTLPGDARDRVRVQVEFDAQDLDTRPPPVRCHLRVYETARGWVLLAWTPDGVTEATAAWLTSQGAFETIDVGGVGGRTLAFRSDALPERWEALFKLFDASYLILEPDGTAQTEVEGTREEVSEFLDGMQLEAFPASVTTVGGSEAGGAAAVLTERQQEALSQAAALGYFEIPREIQLGDLADRLGTSESALSELLRRGQARLVYAHLDNQLGGIEAVLDIGEPAP